MPITNVGPQATQPQGRLTPVSQTPVINSSITTATTIYYDSFNGNLVPVWNGTTYVTLPITSNEVACPLNSTQQSAGSLHDVFAFNNSNALGIGVGPAWSSATPGSSSRGTGAGTTQLVLQNGLWTNAVSITLYNNTTSYVVAANQATYLGSIYFTASGTTSMQVGTTENSTTGVSFGVYNAYNQVTMGCIASDTGSWTYSSTTVRAAHNLTYQRFVWIDGLQSSNVNLSSSVSAQLTSGSPNGHNGFGINSSTAISTLCGQNVIGVTTNSEITITASLAPLFGLNYAQVLEWCDSGTTNITWNGGGTSGNQCMIQASILI